VGSVNLSQMAREILETAPRTSRHKPKNAAKRADYAFEVCDKRALKEAREMVAQHHYAGSSSHRSFGVCAKRDGRVVGAALFLPPLPPAAKKHARTEPRKVITLSRLVVLPEEPTNVESMLIGASLRQLRRDKRYDVVLTFADTSRGHTGAIYKATNAEYCGLTRPEPYWIDKDGRRVSRKATVSRTAAEMRALGYRREVSPGKHCFKWTL
jgi:hypothetical protein